MPRHRRSEVEPSLAPLGAPVDIATNWPEPVRYGYTAGSAAALPARRVDPDDYDYPESRGYQAAARELDWTPAPGGQSWPEWQGWEDFGPPPALHPDHPSAPVPRVQFAADDQWGPEPGPRERRAPDLPQRRLGASARAAAQRPPDGGYDNGQRRLYAVPDDAFDVDYAPPAPDGPGSQGRQFSGQLAADRAEPAWRDTTGFWQQPDPGPREAAGYQRRQPGPGEQEAGDYRYETGPFEHGPESATGQFQNGRASSRDSLWTAGQVITLADGQAAQIAQDAEDYAAAICEAAEREAAAITEQAASVRQAAERKAAAITEQATGQAAAIRAAAEREAAELRARLDSMTGELGRVAAYVTENLGSAAMLATALAPAGANPALPDTISVPPDIRPAKPTTMPGTRPARPDTKPGSIKPGSTRPGSTRPGTTPAKKPQKRSRQQQAMRIATAGTAALLSVAVISGITEIGMKGFPFFVFRQAGTGETRPTAPTDQQFLAREAAAAHNAAAPKGRHHKTPSKTVDEHH